jgi:NhaP-type Na+/H+ or K+/H+ antiporter
MAGKPNNYFVWSILATILCCLPLGIASMVFARRVDAKWNSGDAAGAIAASVKARNFAIAAAVVSGVLVVLYSAATSHR